MKLITVVGARPQFVKAAVVSRAISEKNLKSKSKIDEIIVHTGQHYDPRMSQQFFDELDIPAPKYNLGINKGNHGKMTGRMLEQLERVYLEEKPDQVMVYGDTNSTLAGALAATKLHIDVAHVEAGLRSFNRSMPEEINRVLTDKVSTRLYCPTQNAVQNLRAEGIENGVFLTGDIMFDSFQYYRSQLENDANTLVSHLDYKYDDFVLATCHRAENTDNKGKLEEVFKGLAAIAENSRVVIPLHPRTMQQLSEYGLSHYLDELTVMSPVSYKKMLTLLLNCSVVITDSGGLQKEAYFANKKCITLRNETEWVETLVHGNNQLVPTDSQLILAAFLNHDAELVWPALYGDGNAGLLIAETLED